MFKRIFAVAAAAAVSLLGITAAATAQAAPHARPAGHLHGVRVINLHRAYEARLGHVKPGKISGIVYPAGSSTKRVAKAAATCTEPACPVTWQGGLVQHTPHVYLLLWGPNWHNRSQSGGQRDVPEELLLRARQRPGARTTGPRSPPRTRTAPACPGSPGWCMRAPSTTPARRHSTPATPRSGPRRTRSPRTRTSPTSTTRRSWWRPSRGRARRASSAPVVSTGTTIPPYCAYHSSSNEPYINLPYLPEARAPNKCADDFVNPTPAGTTTGGASSAALSTPTRSRTRSATAGSIPATPCPVVESCPVAEWATSAPG